MDTEGIFLYDDDTNVNYLDWKIVAPDDKNGEDCIVMDFDIHPGQFHPRKQMSDEDCVSNHYFICEKTDTGSCDSSWVTYQGSCYYFSTMENIYPNSFMHCSSLGASLAIISTIEELEFVSLTRSDAWDKKHWIQGTDKQNDGKFIYGDGSTMSFTEWLVGEPNNDNGRQSCVLLEPLTRRKMNDKGCDVERLYVCEKPEQPTDTLANCGSHYFVVNKRTLPGKYSVGRCASKCDGDLICIAFSIGPNNECYPMTTQCTNENICYKRV